MDANKNTQREEVIKIDSLYKIYHLGEEDVVNALDGVSLSIWKNDFVAIMGPSGSGKSTMMNILGCLDTPTSGKYILNGTDVSKMNDGELADVRNKEIGFVFQSFNLLPKYSALENVALPMIYAGATKHERLEKAKKSLNIVGLAERMSHKPSELSGGQKQRVAIARALAKNPKILLCDEPTGALDYETGKRILKILKEASRLNNKTVIIITHNQAITKMADRVIYVKNGKITSMSVQENPVSVEEIEW